LWAALARSCFEKGLAATGKNADEVLDLLDYPKFFELSRQKLPSSKSGILERLSVDRLVNSHGGDYFDITNLGAVLFARDLTHFETLGMCKCIHLVRSGSWSRMRLSTRISDLLELAPW
jgi:predicted HTH transcriptional regulator